MGKRKQVTKVKIAITIDPCLVEALRGSVAAHEHTSLSAAIEHAVRRSQNDK